MGAKTMLDLSQLRAFVTVAEELSFARAAERLNISQAPLSRSIAKLEQGLGRSLFERTTRRVALTAAGGRLLREAAPLIKSAEQVGRTVRHEVADRHSTFEIGTTSLALFTVLPPLLENMQERWPALTPEVNELPTGRLVSSLVEGSIDAAFVLLPSYHEALEIHPIRVEQTRLAVGPAHPFAKEKNVPLAAFANDTFLLHEREQAPAMHDEVIRLCEAAGFRPKVRQLKPGENCIGFIHAGLAVHFVWQCPTCLFGDKLAFVDLEEDSPVLTLAAAWRKDDASELLEPFKNIPRLAEGAIQ